MSQIMQLWPWTENAFQFSNWVLVPVCWGIFWKLNLNVIFFKSYWRKQNAVWMIWVWFILSYVKKMQLCSENEKAFLLMHFKFELWYKFASILWEWFRKLLKLKLEVLRPQELWEDSQGVCEQRLWIKCKLTNWICKNKHWIAAENISTRQQMTTEAVNIKCLAFIDVVIDRLDEGGSWMLMWFVTEVEKTQVEKDAVIILFVFLDFSLSPEELRAVTVRGHVGMFDGVQPSRHVKM